VEKVGGSNRRGGRKEKKGKYKIVEKTMTRGTHFAVTEWGKWTF
jgi:hypothetical protein